MKRKLILLSIVVVLLFGGFLVYKKVFRPSRDITTEKPMITLESTELLTGFQQDETSLYLNKIIAVEGRVTQISAREIVLDDKVHCSFDIETPKLAQDTKIVVKGRCIGYDELFEQVKLDQCVLFKSEKK